jgi:biopolymer transport protein ExbD
MNLIPHEELKSGPNFNFAPMIDFLFLMLSLFATLAISRATLYDTEVHLVSLEAKKDKAHTIHSKKDIDQINISISATGQYKWLTEFEEYPMEHVHAIQAELARQYKIGALAQDKSKTQVLLHIDQQAPWKEIAEVIFAARELGFEAHPVYEPLAVR